MACHDPIHFLRTEVSRLGSILPRKILPMSPLMSMLPKGVYDIGRGRSQKSIRYLPSRPLKVTADFQNIFPGSPTECAALNNEQDTGPCELTARQLGAIAEEVTWEPKWAWWKGPKFCHNDLTTAYDVATQLENVFSVVTDNVKEDINLEYLYDLINLADNTVMPYGDEGGAINVEIFENGDAADICPTCPMTLGVVQYAIQHGWRRGFFGSNNNGGLFGMRNGAPNVLLITGAEAAANLVQYDVRARSVDGYRGTFDVQSLFQPGGSDFLNRFGIRSYCGINFYEIPFPRRGTCSGGTFTPTPNSITDPGVPEGCETVAPNRVATLINPAWESLTDSPIEEAILLLRNDIFEIQSWPVVRNPGGMLQFRDATNFLGEWELVDWRDCVENPLGLFSYPQCVHAYAPKPLSTYGAYKIYFRRCPIAGECGPCS